MMVMMVMTMMMMMMVVLVVVVNPDSSHQDMAHFGRVTSYAS